MAGIEDRILAWIAECPNRQKQKELFVQIVKALGFSYEQCLEAFVGSVMHAWTPDGKPFGELLATELGNFYQQMEWDDPQGDQGKIQARADVAKMIEDQKKALIELDN